MVKIDLRPLFSPVRDQGRRQTCVSFAVTAAHELVRQFNIGKLEPLSEELLYWKCKQIDANKYPGTSFHSASIALDNLGQPHAHKWLYDGFRSETDGSYVPPPAAVDPTACYKAKLKTIPCTVQDIVDCLGDGRVVALGIKISNAFNMTSDGRVPMPAQQQLTAGHAVLVMGYEEDVTGKKWLIFRNSWGEGWGDNGYGYLPCEYIANYPGAAVVIDE